MSSATELVQLELLAQVDDLVRRLTAWTSPVSPWEPLARGQALVGRLLARLETLRSRLHSPLVVATFGGTGTGKSALVNALVGKESSASGRQRPTTTRPVLIVHPETDLGLLGLPTDDFEIVAVDTPILRDIVVLDCPDPDTSEAETAGSNLALLHGLLPFCDVLLYVSTQQKYRSARVTAELAQAATGCRLVFVQTCADLDSDIREDWRRHLSEHYSVPEIFFVDSLRALREQQTGSELTGEFARLRALLVSELTTGRRAQIRRANLLDLCQSALDRCREYCREKLGAVSVLEETLDHQERRQIELMAGRLKDELLTSRQLWERRLLQEVTTRWALTPFSAVLRVYSSLGTLIASAGLWRARSSVQLALIGATQTARWFHARKEELATESRLDRAAALGLDDAVLRETQLVVNGYVRDSGLDPQLALSGSIEHLRSEAVRVEDQFLGDAGHKIDSIISELATRHTGAVSRWVYEFLLCLLLAYIIGWPAFNFFYAHPWLGRPLVPSDFYIHGLVFLVIWSAILVMVFTSRLRVGLVERITDLARQMAQQRLARGLFPPLEQACRDLRIQHEQLEALSAQTAALRREIPVPTTLGSARTPGSRAGD